MSQYHETIHNESMKLALSDFTCNSFELIQSGKSPEEVFEMLATGDRSVEVWEPLEGEDREFIANLAANTSDCIAMSLKALMPESLWQALNRLQAVAEEQGLPRDLDLLGKALGKSITGCEFAADIIHHMELIQAEKATTNG